MSGELKFEIESEGQPYVDEAVYLKNRRPLRFTVAGKTAARAVAAAFGGSVKPVQATAPNFVRRVGLRWMRPDGSGKLVPK